MLILRVLLFPFSILYDLITRLRNHLYNTGQKRSFRFETMVISVGNLSAGGSGKSPMTEYLIRLLKPTYRMATLSRGYGRKTRGIRFAAPTENADTLGDEPYQFFRKFGEEVTVTVGEERAVAIPAILHAYPETDVIVLDDAFQHRPVDPQLSILLTDYNAPFYKDFVLPSGRLRESRKGAARADAVVVTKCPDDLPDQKQIEIQQAIQYYAGDKPVFFSRIVYDETVSFGRESSVPQRDVILVSGIASASLFESYARSRFNVLRHFQFGDHHIFSSSEREELMNYYKSQKSDVVFVTTEKDFARLISDASGDELLRFPWFYIPVRISFVKNGAEFDKIVLRSVEKVKKIS